MDQFNPATRIKLPTAPDAFTPSMIRSAIYRHASLADQEALSRDPDLDPDRLATTFRDMVTTLSTLREELARSETNTTLLNQKIQDRDRAIQELERGLMSIGGLLEGARRELDEAVRRADEAVTRADDAEQTAREALGRIDAAQKALQVAPADVVATLEEPREIERETPTDLSAVTIDAAHEQQARARKSGLFGWLQ